MPAGTAPPGTAQPEATARPEATTAGTVAPRASVTHSGAWHSGQSAPICGGTALVGLVGIGAPHSRGAVARAFGPVDSRPELTTSGTTLMEAPFGATMGGPDPT